MNSGGQTNSTASSPADEAKTGKDGKAAVAEVDTKAGAATAAAEPQKTAAPEKVQSPNCKKCHTKCKTDHCRQYCERKWCSGDRNAAAAVKQAEEERKAA